MARKAASGRPPRRGALVVLAGFLALSGAIRLGIGIESAIARESRPSADVQAGPAQCEPALAMPVVAALAAREERVSAREQAVASRMQTLTVAEAAITARLAELEQAENELAATLAIADGAAEADLARLTAVYEAMKPKEAASIFGSMDPDFAAGFLGRMKPAAAASILAGMPPDGAYEITLLLAGRNATAPTE